MATFERPDNNVNFLLENKINKILVCEILIYDPH